MKARAKEKLRKKEPSRKKLRQLRRKAELKLHFNKPLLKTKLTKLKKLSTKVKEIFLQQKLFWRKINYLSMPRIKDKPWNNKVQIWPNKKQLKNLENINKLKPLPPMRKNLFKAKHKRWKPFSKNLRFIASSSKKKLMN